MLNVVVPYQHKAHNGPWLLILDSGLALTAAFTAMHPGDMRKGVLDTELEDMIELKRLVPGCVTVMASPFPNRKG